MTRRSEAATGGMDPLDWMLATHRSVGDMMAWRRRQSHLTVEQVAECDGVWTPDDVVTVEGSGVLESRLVLRYLQAVTRAIQRRDGAQQQPGGLI